MRFNYRLSRSAKRNLQEISGYWVAQTGEDVTLRIVTGILETIITLSSQPRAGAPAGQFGDGVRKFAAGKYIIYYRLHPPSTVEALHVFHGARDQRKAWLGKSKPGSPPPPV
ncbi:MAG: type II toxin-antitoxin system RelE/ParE family toxin [Bryobacteraceae bacterium]